MIAVLAWALAACANDPTQKSTPPTAMTMPLHQARSHTPTPTAEGALDLRQALAQGLVEPEYRGNGASSGDSIIVELTRKAPRPLELSVPAGTVLRSQDPAVQNMVVLGVRGVPIGGGKFQPTSSIRLTSDAPQEFLLAAYCLDFDKANPSGSTGFSVGELALPEVQAILKALNTAPVAQHTIGAIQTTIWVATEDVCERDLLARFPVAATDITAALALIEAAGLDPATTCLSGQRSAASSPQTKALLTQSAKAPAVPVSTMVTPTQRATDGHTHSSAASCHATAVGAYAHSGGGE